MGGYAKVSRSLRRAERTRVFRRALVLSIVVSTSAGCGSPGSGGPSRLGAADTPESQPPEATTTPVPSAQASLVRPGSPVALTGGGPIEGYRYEVSVAGSTTRTETVGESAPPGKRFVFVRIAVKNLQLDRTAPLPTLVTSLVHVYSRSGDCDLDSIGGGLCQATTGSNPVADDHGHPSMEDYAYGGDALPRGGTGFYWIPVLVRDPPARHPLKVVLQTVQGAGYELSVQSGTSTEGHAYALLGM
jgi:hypothetical protein